MIKAIQTKYKGYRFRSRLEARWAVFFDSLEINWEYENEGYVLQNGNYYLPDFWLPEYETYVECKAQQLNDSEFEKAALLADQSKRQVLLAIGPPDFKEYGMVYGFPTKEDQEVLVNVNFCFIYCEKTKHKRIFYYESGAANEKGLINENDLDHRIVKAIYDSRAARFEHGESGYGQ